jgi:hypothetical protein
MNDIERLGAIEAIKQLKARYFRSMDTKDWAGLRGVFCDDAVLDMRGETGDDSGLVQGGDAVAASIRTAVTPFTTVHHGHTPEIEILSPTSARGIWAMEDVLTTIDGAPSPYGFRNLRGYGHYHETYQCVAGDWRIKSSRLTRLRKDID